ncbi:MAG: amidohydrolase family protein [Flavobacteriales bacterium]|jgi:imidazolonepropionase-like amidohydrolase
MKHIFPIILILSALNSFAQFNPAPAPAQKKSVLIMNATAHIGNGEVIENSVVGFKEGKITFVADARTVRIDMSAYDTIIQASGMHLYPGFIASNTTLGLHEIDAVRAQNDVSEVGTYKPSVRSAIAFNTDSEITPTVRSNGVLMGQITPRGGTISGTSSVMHFDAWNWEDALVREDDGIHINWPQVYHKHYDKGKVSIEKVKSYDQQLTEISLFFNEARAYAALAQPALMEIRYEAMRDIFNGKKTLYVHADDVKAIGEALRFKREMSIPRMVIVGGYDSWMMANDLKEAGVGVMIRRIHELPALTGDDIDLPFKLPRLLHEAGVKFSFQNEGDMERMGARNLPFHAGTAVAYGLPYEAAVRALTLGAAELLGISENYGSIESGKSATLILSTGDALDMMTNNIIYAFIDGRSLTLSDKHKVLYERYKKRD